MKTLKKGAFARKVQRCNVIPSTGLRSWKGGYVWLGEGGGGGFISGMAYQLNLADIGQPNTRLKLISNKWITEILSLLTDLYWYQYFKNSQYISKSIWHPYFFSHINNISGPPLSLQPYFLTIPSIIEETIPVLLQPVKQPFFLLLFLLILLLLLVLPCSIL